MRIISGKFRGKKLCDSESFTALRPTTDKNRESLFNIISSGKFIKETKFEIAEAKILDVCSGSGSVSFEFLSRGAKSAFLIDNNSSHLNLAKKNAKLLNLEEACKFMLCDVKKNLAISSEEFDLIFIDPPYEEDYKTIISNLIAKKWITEKSIVIVEFDSANKDIEEFVAENFAVLDLRKYGKTTFVFFRL
ncbi:MAG: 16S rRNA (guanine(966)-N(2))-methyltransferase RsmD [Rickettsiales bacterium]|nr:16S rRNA (guanine(966)-N(2))-methyltransferase RsmD [Rickettsiales bacterium]